MQFDPRTTRANDAYDEDRLSMHSAFTDPPQTPGNGWNIPFRESSAVDFIAPRWVQCYGDWQVPDASHDFPWVECYYYDPITKATTGSLLTVYLPIAWDASYLAKPAPELFSSDKTMVSTDYHGLVTVTGPLAFSFLGEVRDYTGSSTNIPDGWVLCDYDVLPADKKVTASNAPDMRGCFTMGIDPADAAGDGSEDAIGDTGGAREHDNHRHALDMATTTDEQVIKTITWDPGTTDATLSTTNETVITNASGIYTSGHDALAGGGTAYDDTRSPYYVTAKIYRYK